MNRHLQDPRQNDKENSGEEGEREHIISVLLVDDHKLVRQSIKKVVNRQGDIKVIGVADNGEEAVRMARKTSPQVILMDINMPVMDGMEATKIIKSIMPEICIVGLSLHDTPEVLNNMLNAGASAFVSKGEKLEKLYNTIRHVISSQE